MYQEVKIKLKIVLRPFYRGAAGVAADLHILFKMSSAHIIVCFSSLTFPRVFIGVEARRKTTAAP